MIIYNKQYNEENAYLHHILKAEHLFVEEDEKKILDLIINDLVNNIIKENGKVNWWKIIKNLGRIIAQIIFVIRFLKKG